MTDLREWIDLVFALILGIAGWKFGYSQHANIKQGDAVHFPFSLRYLLGVPNDEGVYNIRGIYFQLFVAIILVPFVASDFGLVSRLQAFQIFLLAMIIFPILEILRYLSRKKL